jgi:hypothetical protein
MLYIGIEENMESIIIEHLMNVYATYNNGIERKGKYKRIKRPEKFNKLANDFTEGKIIMKNNAIIKERREEFKKRTEKNKRFFERIRREDYIKRIWAHIS